MLSQRLLLGIPQGRIYMAHCVVSNIYFRQWWKISSYTTDSLKFSLWHLTAADPNIALQSQKEVYSTKEHI